MPSSAEELLLKITGDATGGQKAVDDIMKGVNKTVAALGGDGLFGAANKVTIAIDKLGGVTRLTADEQARATTIIEKAIEKHLVLGTKAPAAYNDLLESLRKVTQQTAAVDQPTKNLTTSMVALGSAVGTFAGTIAGDIFNRFTSGAVGMVGDAFKMNASLETTTLKFTTLMGDSDKAAIHVKDLFEIAKKTPFETGPIIEASLKLQTFGGAALNTKANIMLLGDASAATGAPINELGFWVGRMYAMLQGGKPFGEAAMRLQELAVLSPQARDQMEAMQKSGKSAAEIFDVFKGSLSGFTGAMQTQAGTWEGVMSTFTDTVNMMMADTLKPYFEVIRDLGKNVNNTLDSMSSSMDNVSAATASTKQGFADLITGGLEGTARAVSFVVVEFNAAQVIFRDVAQVVDGVVLAMQELAYWDLKLLNTATFGKAFKEQLGEVDEAIGKTLIRMKQRGDALQDDKKAEQDWAAWGDKAVASVEEMTRGLGAASIATEVHTQKQETVATTVAKVTAAQKAYAAALVEYNSVGATAKATIQGLSDAQVEGIRYDLAREITQGTLVKVYKVTKEQVEAVAQVMKDEKVAAKDLLEIHNKIEAGAYGLEKAIGHVDESELKYLKTQISVNDALKMVEQSIPSAVAGFYSLAGSLETVGQKSTEIDELKLKLKSFHESALEMTLKDIPNIIQQSFTGGGGIVGASKAIGSNVGKNIGTDLMQSLQQKAMDNTGQAMTGIAGKLVSALPMVGSLLGPAMSALMSKIMKIGGPSQAELDGRKIEATFEAQFGSFQKMMDAVGAAYVATGKTAQQAQADVKALMDAEKQGAAATQSMVDKINSAFSDQKQDAADLTAAIQKYGFSIEQLGPAMQKQDLDGQAKTLINDWRLLVGSGMEVVTVDQKMASSTWDYLQMARRTGQEIPEAMKPVIQSMIDQGVFTDEAGQKITDMGALGLTFSSTMTQGFDKVVSKLNDLLVAIGIKIPQGVAEAASATKAAAHSMVDDLGDVEDAVNYVTHGRSPTGLKQIPIALKDIVAGFTDMAHSAGIDLGGVESDINKVLGYARVNGGLDKIPTLSLLGSQAIRDLSANSTVNLGDLRKELELLLGYGATHGGLQQIPDLAKLAQLGVAKMAQIMGVSIDDVTKSLENATSHITGLIALMGDFSKTRATLGSDKDPNFSGYAALPEIISEADAIKRVNEVFQHYDHRDANAAELAQMRASYGGVPGGNVVKGRLETYLQKLVSTYLQGQLDGVENTPGTPAAPASAPAPPTARPPIYALLDPSLSGSVADALAYITGQVGHALTASEQQQAAALVNYTGGSVTGAMVNQILAALAAAAKPMKFGGAGTVTRPTLFLAGEGGDEDFAFSGGGKSFRGGGGGTVIHIDASRSMFRDRASLQELADLVGRAQADRARQTTQFGLRTGRR